VKRFAKFNQVLKYGKVVSYPGLKRFRKISKFCIASENLFENMMGLFFAREKLMHRCVAWEWNIKFFYR